MTKNNPAKEYLQQAYRLDIKIKDKTQELERLRELSTSVSSSTVEGNSGTDLEREIETEVSGYIDLKREISDRINAIADDNSRIILYKRYVLNLSFEQIAVDMGYVYRHTTREHGKALKEFQKIHKDVL